MTVFSTQDKNKAMPQKKLLVIGLFSLTVALSGCATDGNYYRSDVYSSSQVNQAQRVNTVEIIAINPAQVAVNNSENSDRARATGAILGAIAGAAIGNHNNHSTSSRVLGGLAGGAIGGLAGDAVGGPLRFGEKFVAISALKSLSSARRHAAADEALPFFQKSRRLDGCVRKSAL